MNFSEDTDFNVFEDFHVINDDMVIDLPRRDSYFRYVSYFPVIKYNMKLFFDSLPYCKDANQLIYYQRRAMILNKLDLAKPFVRLEPDLRYLTTLLKATQFKLEEQTEKID
jgi:hypothetical protein